jgi:hypothetical protein
MVLPKPTKGAYFSNKYLILFYLNKKALNNANIDKKFK